MQRIMALLSWQNVEGQEYEGTATLTHKSHRCKLVQKAGLRLTGNFAFKDADLKNIYYLIVEEAVLNFKHLFLK